MCPLNHGDGKITPPFSHSKKSSWLRCVWKPGGSSLAPYFEGILDTPSSLAPFQAPASWRQPCFIIVGGRAN